MDGMVAAAVMDERLKRLQTEIVAGQVRFNTACVGRTTGILLERPGRHAGQLVGKSPWLQSVHVEAGPHAKIGDMVVAELISAGPNSMGGAVVAPVAA
jgi:tRNA-2-methylthio-N6-dimethylallyladenosine synthase